MLPPLPSDIKVDGETFEAKELNHLLKGCVHLFANALDSHVGLVSRDACHIVAQQLDSHLWTHSSIGTLASRMEEKPQLLGDTYSLLREQIERVFVVTRLLSDSKKWSKIYFQYDAASEIRYQLEMVTERGHISRFQDEVQQPDYYGLGAHAESSYLRPEQLVRLVLEVYDLMCYLPPRLNLSSKVEPFPTPGGVLGGFDGTPQWSMLKRWYVEYKHKSGHAHLGLNKLIHAQQSATAESGAHNPRLALQELAVNEVHALSWLALASILTEVLHEIRPSLTTEANVDLSWRLAEYWDRLRPLSLLAVALWDVRGKNVLPSF